MSRLGFQVGVQTNTADVADMPHTTVVVGEYLVEWPFILPFLPKMAF
jgi:hypothetical protein